jgi:hypothetical protein
MAKTKPKPDIYWLPEDEYKKAVFRLRSNVYDILSKTYDMYGMSAYHDGATKALVDICEDFALICRGVDKPIKNDYKKPY